MVRKFFVWSRDQHKFTTTDYVLVANVCNHSDGFKGVGHCHISYDHEKLSWICNVSNDTKGHFIVSSIEPWIVTIDVMKISSVNHPSKHAILQYLNESQGIMQTKFGNIVTTNSRLPVEMIDNRYFNVVVRNPSTLGAKNLPKSNAYGLQVTSEKKSLFATHVPVGKYTITLCYKNSSIMYFINKCPDDVLQICSISIDFQKDVWIEPSIEDAENPSFVPFIWLDKYQNVPNELHANIIGHNVHLALGKPNNDWSKVTSPLNFSVMWSCHTSLANTWIIHTIDMNNHHFIEDYLDFDWYCTQDNLIMDFIVRACKLTGTIEPVFNFSKAIANAPASTNIVHLLGYFNDLLNMDVPFDFLSDENVTSSIINILADIQFLNVPNDGFILELCFHMIINADQFHWINNEWTLLMQRPDCEDLIHAMSTLFNNVERTRFWSVFNAVLSIAHDNHKALVYLTPFLSLVINDKNISSENIESSISLLHDQRVFIDAHGDFDHPESWQSRAIRYLGKSKDMLNPSTSLIMMPETIRRFLVHETDHTVEKAMMYFI